jgi:hypothetical protein
MTRRVVTFLVCCVVGLPFASADFKGNNALTVSAIGSSRNANAGTPAAAFRIDGAGEQMAYKYLATTTSPITAIDFFMDIQGTVTGINFTVEVQTDSSDTPSGSTLGAASAAFAGLAADGWTGLKTLGTNTGNLTVGTPYWVVVQISSGTPDASNYIMYRRGGQLGVGNKQEHYNGTDWTTDGTDVGEGVRVHQHSDGTYSGNAIHDTAIGTTSTAPDIFSTNKQGLKVTFGSFVKILGALVIVDKVGTPGNLTVRVYSGSTEQAASPAYAPTSILDVGATVVLLSSPILLPPNTACYIILEQDGASGSDDYDMEGYDYNTTYTETVIPNNVAWVYGTGSDPTTFTVETDFIPRMELLLSDPLQEIQGRVTLFDTTLYDATLN